MAKKKSKKKINRRSAVHVAGALRSGSGRHRDKSKYRRNPKHKGGNQ